MWVERCGLRGVVGSLLIGIGAGARQPGHRALVHELVHPAADLTEPVDIVAELERLGDPVREQARVLDAAAAGGHGGRADAQPAGDEGRPLLAGHRVLVHGDPREAEHALRLLAGVLETGQVDEHQVVVRAARDELEAALHETRGHGLGVGEHAIDVGRELRTERLAERHRLAGDDVHERPALGTGEDRVVEVLHPISPTEGYTTPRTTQGLVGGARHVLAVREGAGVPPDGDHPGHVGDVGDQDGPHFVGDLRKGLEVPEARVGRAARHDELRTFPAGGGTHFVHVDEAAGGDVVAEGLVVHAADVVRRPVRQVTAVGEVEAEDGVSGLERREVHGGVGLGAGVRLDVEAPLAGIEAEQLQTTILGGTLDDVDGLAAAVVTPAGLPFGVLVGEDAADGDEHARRDVVLAGDELEVTELAVLLGRDGGGDDGVVAPQQLTGKHGRSLRLQISH